VFAGALLASAPARARGADRAAAGSADRICIAARVVDAAPALAVHAAALAACEEASPSRSELTEAGSAAVTGGLVDICLHSAAAPPGSVTDEASPRSGPQVVVVAYVAN
jgi:hypothetical protein